MLCKVYLKRGYLWYSKEEGKQKQFVNGFGHIDTIKEYCANNNILFRCHRLKTERINYYETHPIYLQPTDYLDRADYVGEL